MIVCPNCGSSAQPTKIRDSYDRPETHNIYVCGCGKLFVAEKQKDEEGDE